MSEVKLNLQWFTTVMEAMQIYILRNYSKKIKADDREMVYAFVSI